MIPGNHVHAPRQWRWASAQQLSMGHLQGPQNQAQQSQCRRQPHLMTLLECFGRDEASEVGCHAQVKGRRCAGAGGGVFQAADAMMGARCNSLDTMFYGYIKEEKTYACLRTVRCVQRHSMHQLQQPPQIADSEQGELKVLTGRRASQHANNTLRHCTAGRCGVVPVENYCGRQLAVDMCVGVSAPSHPSCSPVARAIPVGETGCHLQHAACTPARQRRRTTWSAVLSCHLVLF